MVLSPRGGPGGRARRYRDCPERLRNRDRGIHRDLQRGCGRRDITPRHKSCIEFINKGRQSASGDRDMARDPTLRWQASKTLAAGPSTAHGGGAVNSGGAAGGAGGQRRQGRRRRRPWSVFGPMWIESSSRGGTSEFGSDRAERGRGRMDPKLQRWQGSKALVAGAAGPPHARVRLRQPAQGPRPGVSERWRAAAATRTGRDRGDVTARCSARPAGRPAVPT